MKKKVCVVTATRAEYSFLKPLLQKLKTLDTIELQIIVTGTHLEKKYGYTLSEIKADGFSPTTLVPIMEDDSQVGIISTMANALKNVGQSLSLLKPDMLVVLGDRYETFALASACPVLGIPIAHISGGDVTYGAYDDIFRHCLTKMSYLHFVSCDVYKRRVIQMGENPDRVFNVGSLSIENLRNTELFTKEEIEQVLCFPIENSLLTTFHPVTMECDSQKQQFRELLLALAEQKKYSIIFCKPNADTNRSELSNMLDHFSKKYPDRVKVVESLGVVRYLSAMKYCSGVVGNSSSGLFEAPSLKKGTVNIGNRQKGRICAASVLNCLPQKEDIKKALDTLSEESFIHLLKTVKNPYEQENTSHKIATIIEKYLYSENNIKIFYDLNSEKDAYG